MDSELKKNFGFNDKTGLVVVNVTDDSPAENAGIKRGALIVEVNNIVVNTLEGFKKAVSKALIAVRFLPSHIVK